MEKFKIPAPPSRPTSKIVHIRFPADMVEDVTKVIKGTDCTFSRFIVEATRFALGDLKVNK